MTTVELIGTILGSGGAGAAIAAIVKARASLIPTLMTRIATLEQRADDMSVETDRRLTESETRCAERMTAQLEDERARCDEKIEQRVREAVLDQTQRMRAIARDEARRTLTPPGGTPAGGER